MLDTFILTGERYLDYCNERKYEVSDFVRRTFRHEINNIKKTSEEDYIYMKLCGNNKVITEERITDEQLKGFCEILEEDVSIKSIDLRYNLITNVGAKYIGILLKRNSTIEELNLMGNDIEEEGAKYLGEALRENKTLKILKLTGNKIGCDGAMHIAQALQINDTLEELDVGECDLKIQSVIAFSTVLKCNTTIQSINLDRPLLWTQQEEPTVHMEMMLYQNKTLKELHLAKFVTRDFGMERLCDALIVNTTLTVLDLSCNRITRDGCRIMAKVLAKNTPLQLLDLGYNRIHDDGLIAISKALCYCNSNLKCLVITYNEIGEEGLLALSRAMKLNSTLDSVYIWGNYFTSKACEAIGVLIDTFRLMSSKTDVRHYFVDGQFYFAYLGHSVDYRSYRYTAPIYGDDIPQNRSYAIM